MGYTTLNPNDSSYRQIHVGDVCRNGGGALGTHFMVAKGADATLPQTMQRDGKTYRLVNYGTLGAAGMYVENVKF